MKLTSSILFVIISFIGLFISYTHSFPEGSLSLACGFSNNPAPEWISDEPFTKNRSSGVISNPPALLFARFAYFDNLAAKKYCYSIPVKRGALYLLRTHFYAVAFQTDISLATIFDLFINEIKWTEVNPNNIDTYEIILTAKSDNMSLCLARNSQTEKEKYVWITEILVRNLNSALYNSTDFNNSALVLLNRSTFGRDSLIAYPEDEVDRIWRPNSPATYNIMNTPVEDFGKDLKNQPPVAVLQTAITTKQVGDLVVSYPLPSGSYYFALYFCNLKRANHSFQVSINDDQTEGEGWLHFTSFLQCVVEERKPKFDRNGSVDITLHPEEGSQTGPFINAAEAYQIRDIQKMTDLGDVMAIREIADSINAPDDWFGGDPCLPAGYPCTGIVCNDDNPSRVIILNLTDFGLSGKIPPIIANLTAVTQLLLGSNNLSGSIPDLSSLKNLAMLELQNNQLTGEIPTSLAKLPALKRLYLENNKLDSTVPPELHRPDLDLRVTASNFPAVNKSHRTRNWIVGCVVGASLIVAVVATFLWKHHLRSRAHITDRSINPRPEIHGDVDHAKEYHRLAVEYTEEEIKAATNNINSRLIGKGGFGPVYFGTLSGYEVAIKILSKTSDRGQKEFETEVTFLSRLYHKNLVKLIGYSKLPMGALVYEYMPCGTLKDHLHGKAKLVKPLDWNTRLNIALQAAQGLLYLHQGCNPPIIHRDIKCTNILLDAKMTAKVADFGLAKLLDISKTRVSTKVKGTLGYLHPEYIETWSLTTKSDVYSFGVALLEIISGKLPSDEIVALAIKLLSCGKIIELMDPSLGGHYKLSTAWKVAEVAYTCVAKKSLNRPTMSTVVEELKEALAIEFNDSSQYVPMLDMTLNDSDLEMMPMAR